MNNSALQALASWQNFYVIVGSAAGALTGLQFVVMTLVTQARSGSSMRDIHAFGTPTVVYFCTALGISALMTAPWPSASSLAICMGVCGAVGVAYSMRVFSHARYSDYKPDMEDRFWYHILPFLAFIALIVVGVCIWLNIWWSLVLIAADALVFLLIGVHNAWDTVTYIAVKHASRTENKL